MPEPKFGSTDIIKSDKRLDRLVLDRFEITAVSGPDKGTCRSFGQEVVQIGTARSNDLVLSDRTVSRFHLRIETDKRSFAFVDLGSTNGTWIGGIRVEKAFLSGGALVDLGASQLRFRPLGDTTTVELPLQDRLGALIGGSAKMRKLYGLVTKMAPSELPVIIEGETGTGKDLVARAIHELSPRATESFEVLDCGAIPETLMESELFGHVKGAFTGADRDRAGVFERAQGGTVFLDEIGELGIDLQPKLLRALENREIRRLGDERVVHLDVRVLAATNRSLGEMVNKGEFREDLYYRLAGFRLQLPALRDRPEDIPLLVAHFLELSSSGTAGRVAVPTLDEQAIQAFCRHPWPGNVRQLRNAVERLAVTGVADFDEGSGLTQGPNAPEIDRALRLPFREAKEAFERLYLDTLIRRHGGDVRRAAESAEIHPKSLGRMLRRHATEE